LRDAKKQAEKMPVALFVDFEQTGRVKKYTGGRLE